MAVMGLYEDFGIAIIYTPNTQADQIVFLEDLLLHSSLKTHRASHDSKFILRGGWNIVSLKDKKGGSMEVKGMLRIIT